MRPIVGRMPTSMFELDGLITDPPVSLPTLADQKLAAVPMPELDPPAASAGRPSQGAPRGPGVEGGLARFGTRIVGVVAEAADCVVVARHRRRIAGHPVRQLGEAGL